MKEYIPLFSLLTALLMVVAGTVWLVITYPQKKEPVVGEYNLSGKRAQTLQKQVSRFVEMKKYREAENLLRLAISALPGNTKVAAMRGKIHYLKGELDQAEIIFRQLSIAVPEDPVIRNNLGVVLTAKGLYESGVRSLLAAEKLSGGARYTFENLTQAFFLAGNFLQAKRCWELARTKPQIMPAEVIQLLPPADGP